MLSRRLLKNQRKNHQKKHDTKINTNTHLGILMINFRTLTFYENSSPCINGKKADSYRKIAEELLRSKDEKDYSPKESEVEEVVKELKEIFRKINDAFKNEYKTSTSNDSEDGENLDRKNRDVGFLTLYDSYVKANHYVGFGVFRPLVVQVLPKVFEPKTDSCTRKHEWDSIIAFLRMLNTAYNLGINDADLMYLKERMSSGDVFEIFIYLFAKSLWEEVQRGYYREYESYTIEGKYLRGKLLVSKQIRKLPHERHKFSLEVHEFTEDNLLNQIFYAATRFSISVTRWQKNRKMLGELMLIFDGITPKRITISDFEKIRFTRLNERFKRPFTFAKIILTSFAGFEKDEASGFFVDMNELFERFILSELKRSLPGYKIKYQKKLEIFRSKKKIRLRRQYPDFVVYRFKKPIAVIDAKYRALNLGGDKIGLDPDAARQVYTYAKILDEEEGITNVTVLIYPRSDNFNNYDILRGQDLKELPNATFFDGKKRVYVITYDLEALKSEREKSWDINFRNVISKLISSVESQQISK